LHPDAVMLRLCRGEAVLHESVIAPQPPHIGAASMERIGNDVTVRAAAEAATGLTYAVAVESESGTRLRIAEGLTEPAHVFEIGEIPMTGTVRVLVEVSDGVRSSESEAGLLDRPPVPVTVHMLAPATSAPLPFGQPVSLLGCWLDESGTTHPGDARQWFLNGEPYPTGPIAVIDAIAAGSHRLTLAGHMPQGTDETSTEFVIAEPDHAYEDWRSLMGHLRPV
jgi:hypothetical protein